MKRFTTGVAVTKTVTSQEVSPGDQRDAEAFKLKLKSTTWDSGDYVDVKVNDGMTSDKSLGRYHLSEELTFQGPASSVKMNGVGTVLGNNTSVTHELQALEAPPAFLQQRTYRQIKTADANTAVAVPVPELAKRGAVMGVVCKGTWTAGQITSITGTRDGVPQTFHSAIGADGVLKEFAGCIDALVINVGATFQGTVDVAFTFTL